MLTRTLLILASGALVATGAAHAAEPTHKAPVETAGCKLPHKGTLTAAERKAHEDCLARERAASTHTKK